MDVWEQIAALRREGVDAVVITITAVRGSVPGQVGAKAVVTSGGLVSGNLGGGKVEAKALAYAAEMLAGNEPCASVTWNLQRDVGMTCGGEMSFFFEKITALDPWHIAIFGAGHVSQALVPVLATLACRIDVFDTRADWLAKLPVRRNVTAHRVESFEDGVGSLGADSFVLCVTRGHSSDRPVLREVFRRFPEPVFVGVIGSASKRAVLLRELLDDGIHPVALEKIHCPVGLPIGGNDPAEIAISISAQLLEFRGQGGFGKG
jgi:xanthine dehydrogenase accessory factor